MTTTKMTLSDDNSFEVSPQIDDKFNLECNNDRPKGYCHDNTVNLNYPNWMDKLSNNVCLGELSLPGTHDTMSFYGGDAVQCQSMPLETQLKSGIRVLDVRCRHIADVFAIHHGIVFQNTFFGDVLNDTIKFLHENPSETIYMRVQEEYKPEKITRTFEETFRIGYWNSFKNYLWQPSQSKSPRNPPLSETRGKIVILQNFSSREPYGIEWKEFLVQDDYHMGTNWDLYDKWMKVKCHLNCANKEKTM